MKINWIVRIKNKEFWVGFIPAVLLLIQTIAAPFGIELDFGVLSEQLLNIVNAVFVLLVLVGVVVDPTTKGINDSEQAMSYTEPK